MAKYLNVMRTSPKSGSVGLYKIGCWAVLGADIPLSAPAEEPARKPKIIIVLTDDLGCPLLTNQ